MKHQEAFDLLNEQLINIPKMQIRSMSLEVLPRLIDRIDSNQNQCSACKDLNITGEAFIHDIKPIFNQDKETIKKFENWVDESQKHLKKEHQQTPKGRLTSTYTTIGMAIGTVIAYLIIKITGQEGILSSISIGWAIGMLAGYIIGKVKEKKLTRNNKLY